MYRGDLKIRSSDRRDRRFERARLVPPRGIARPLADRLMAISLSRPVVIHSNKLCGAMH